MRVALIFDDATRPDTTGVYCRRALEKLAEVEHFRPDDLSRIPSDGFDVYLHIDDGLRYELPPALRPCAYWAIDTHLDFDWHGSKARGFDLVFAAQQDGADRLRAAGIETAEWLPLACDPGIHARHDVPKSIDVCFVGNVFPGPRADLLELIRSRFENVFAGRQYFEDMARTYSASRIVFNRSIRNDVNMRVFEAAACGSLLITNDLADNGQEELFESGVHVVTYAGADDLLAKIRHYLGHEDERERIAAAGRQHALEHHTYEHRMRRVLESTARKPKTARPCAARPAPLARDPGYFEFARPDLIELIPKDARRVLDVGCGAGRLGEALKQRQEAHVVGIELDERAAAAARHRMDDVVVGDVESPDLALPEGHFDCIVLGDVLEHLRDPAAVLRRLRPVLAEGGVLVASIPNARHHTVVSGLLDGDWTYVSTGLLDADHLRFFTRREIEKLLTRAGFEIAEVRAVPGPGYDEWRRQTDRRSVAVGALYISGLPEDQAEEFFVYQYLIRATAAPTAFHGLTSIVIPTFNQLSYTRQCLDSIRCFTDEPYEIIVVDNGSTDGTPDYLSALADVQLIRNEENRGFPAAVNQGIQAAKGSQVLLLNNDTVVTSCWLTRLLRCLHSDPQIGLVGPCSNFVSGPQQIPVRYRNLAGLDGFAWDVGKASDGRYEDVDRLVGFCLLIRREVVNAVGLLDERVGIGTFEDDDYCRRALGAGYRAVIARDAFVHHFGGRTFVGEGVDFSALMRENQRRFRDKWSGQAQPAAPSPGETEPGPAKPGASLKLRLAPGGGLLLARDGPLLSLCMIVRDSRRTLRACLESVKPWVDEMIVVDTGSQDDTKQIARSLGARVHEFPWCDDFSAARNESLRYATGEWVFWMDADDTIDPKNGGRLQSLVRRNHPEKTLGHVLQVHCPGGQDDGDEGLTVVDHVKVFRNRPNLRFEGRVHEQILPAIRRAGGEVEWTDIHVVHSGYDHTPEGQRRKRERDLRLLQLELEERPDHPFTLFNLGMTYSDIGRHEEAIQALERSIEVSDPRDSHVRKAYALLVGSHRGLKDQEQAWAACQRGRQVYPNDPELLFLEGILNHHFGRHREAEASYRRLLANREGRHFSSVDQGILGFKAHQNLAVLYADMGEWERAEREWRQVVEQMPDYLPGWRGLGTALLEQGKLTEAEQLAASMTDGPRLEAEGIALRARARVRLGDVQGAMAELQAAVSTDPSSLEPLRAMCEILYHHGPLEEAQAAIRQLLERDPGDASAHHNLGTVCLRMGRYEEAAAALEESVRIRPESAETWSQLGHARKLSGRAEEATAEWRHALSLAPGLPSAREGLEGVGAAPVRKESQTPRADLAK